MDLTPRILRDGHRPGAGETDACSQLQRVMRGPVRVDAHMRGLYSTDASLYQVEPLAVAVPADGVDVRNLLRFCDAHKLPVLPRGGGTSLAGQGVNAAVACDLSEQFRSVRALDAQGDWIEVESGMSIDEVNRYLSRNASTRFFAPDPATSAQCAIGGAIGNNAAGARSIRYGRTSENVLGLELILPGGSMTWLESGAGRHCPVARRLASEVAAIARRYGEEIRARFPKLNRRNAGYSIDGVLQQLDAGVADDCLDLTGLICGSEGTLGIVTAAKLKLHPVPTAKGLAVLSFGSLEEAIEMVVPLVDSGAIAVELLDDAVLKTAANNPTCRGYLDLVANVNGRSPSAVLYVEYQQEQEGISVNDQLDRLRGLASGVPTRIYLDPGSMQQAWSLRKAAEPLLHALSAHRKPQTFVEDNSIPIQNLSRFVREFEQIVTHHGTEAAYYAHAGVGVLHVRPMIDLRDPRDRAAMRAIAEEVAELARACGGVMSGEHGDGRARGPLLERFFGPRLMECFRQIKQVFDPHHILNPGMIVGAGPVESISSGLRVDAGDVPDVDAYYDYSDQEGFAGAVEMCNGAGFCRKTAGGVMCPSYRATLEERHSTRGRANALRLAIGGQFGRTARGTPDFEDPQTVQTLDLCLSCKACKSECPSNVDVARLKAEYTAQRYRRTGVPIYARLMGNIRTLNRLGSLVPGIANFVAGTKTARRLAAWMLGLAPQRSLPTYARSLYRQARFSSVAAAPKVVLFGDCFVTYNEPDIGLASIRLLEAFGYQVLLPKVGCCGRAMMSLGMLKQAIATADRTLVDLRPFIDDPDVVAVVVAEPSCLAAFKDDWLSLKLHTPLDLRKRLAEKSYLIEEFLDRRWADHPRHPGFADDQGDVILHGHCHQKAICEGGDRSTSDMLRRVAGQRVWVLDSGCCGMAGSFGYMASRYDLSMRVGELSVFAPVREAPADTAIVAPGTSCRHQIHDGTGRHAVHPAEWLASRLVTDREATASVSLQSSARACPSSFRPNETDVAQGPDARVRPAPLSNTVPNGSPHEG